MAFFFCFCFKHVIYIYAQASRDTIFLDQNFVVISEVKPERNRRTLPIFYLSTSKRKSELYMEKSQLKVQGLSNNLSAYNLHLFRKKGGKNIHTYIHTCNHTYADLKEKKGATHSLL